MLLAGYSKSVDWNIVLAMAPFLTEVCRARSLSNCLCDTSLGRHEIGYLQATHATSRLVEAGNVSVCTYVS